MAVFTKLNRIKFKNIIKNYNLGRILFIKGILSGTENTNYFLSTKNGEYVITLFENLEKKEIIFFLSLLKILYYKNINVPKIIKRKDGKLITKVKKIKNIVIISTRIFGLNIKDANFKNCSEIGKKNGTFSYKKL